MTRTTKDTWKAVGWFVVTILTAIGVYAALVGAGILPRHAKLIARGDDLEFSGYTWQILRVEDGRALLLSRDIIEQRAYNDYDGEDEAVTWETCTLRAYLNGAFYESFSTKDRARIALTRNENPDNTWGRYEGEPLNTPGGEPTEDYIFLLSVEEILKYYPGLKPEKFKQGNAFGTLLYKADERLTATFKGEICLWWLRSPGDNPYCAVAVSDHGQLYLCGDGVPNATGVRPALWLNL